MNFPKQRSIPRQSLTTCICIEVDIFSQLILLTAQGEQQVLKAPHLQRNCKETRTKREVSYIENATPTMYQPHGALQSLPYMYDVLTNKVKLLEKTLFQKMSANSGSCKDGQMCNRYSVYRIEQGRKITEIQHEKQDDKIIDGLITYMKNQI